ncbi:hypothetical protein ABZ714_12980 [Streptomyces sp. NPDC006798]|uniref:hypothetical protein n=1 Tax=Streptomyces sp. NPDC006798 TaxID=3155462 RepID=UPI0033C2846D
MKAPDLPRFIVHSSRWGWNNGSEFRCARDEQNVRNILRGLHTRYGTQLDTAVFTVGESADVTTRFVIPKENA